MFQFEPKKTAIYRAVKLEKLPFFKFARKISRLSFAAGAVFLVLSVAGLFVELSFLKYPEKMAGLSVLALDVWLVFWIAEKFIELKIKNPRVSQNLKEALAFPFNVNWAEFLSFEAARAARAALLSMKKREISSSHLFYFLLEKTPKMNFIFSRALVDKNQIRQALKPSFSAPGKKEAGGKNRFQKDFEDTIIKAANMASQKKKARIDEGDILTALAAHNDIFKKIMIDSDLEQKDIENLVLWAEALETISETRRRFWDRDNLVRAGSLAKEWTAGYTLALDRFSFDVTDLVRRGFTEVAGHKEEIEAAERALSLREINNVLLVGEPGTGRKSIVHALAFRSLIGRGLPEMNYKRVVQLDLPGLLAQSADSEEAEAVLDKIFQETIRAGNIILLIDEFHNYIGQASGLGVVDIAGVIGQYLHLPEFQLIAVCTYDGLHRNIERNSSILSLFNKVEVTEISKQDTLRLLEDRALLLEAKYKIYFSYPAIKEAFELAERYMPSSPFPEKALDILDEAAVFADSHQEKMVLERHISLVVAQKTDIPVGEMAKKEKEVLLNLERLIHQRIINQEEAVKEVSTAMRRARSGITVRKGPMGAFLFLGPTGVGKTETSKALAEFYFGSESRMHRLDMSEFQEIKDIARLLGSEQEPGLLVAPVRESPFALLLLDEIEKAHSNILNLFLQVIDEGHITDGRGKKVDFRNTIIIATSNAGYKIILKSLKEKTPWGEVKELLLDYLFEEGIFRPEFINRFDDVVVFGPLSKNNLQDISELVLGKLKENLKTKGIEFEITEALKAKIAELGYNPVFGAREMRRVIQDKAENVLAQALLSGKIKRGDRVRFNHEDFSLIING